uniref:Uncharacterized protein n=1 Tax=Setaria italica TaxID=4555 RepID=K3YP05_SETIT
MAGSTSLLNMGTSPPFRPHARRGPPADQAFLKPRSPGATQQAEDDKGSCSAGWELLGRAPAACAAAGGFVRSAL